MIEELDKEIAERLKPYPQQLKLACTVPGIKPSQRAQPLGRKLTSLGKVGPTPRGKDLVHDVFGRMLEGPR
jgi:hypothetical protein